MWIKEPSFLDLQKAIQVLMVSDEMDLPSYWDYAFTHWVEKTEPVVDLRLATKELGMAVAQHLPSPQVLFDVLGFSKARPQPSENI